MSISKKRNIDQIFELKKEIKQLNETIRKLERNNQNEVKKEKALKKSSPKVVEKKEPVQGKCPDCSEGKIEVIDLSFRKLLVCSVKCGFKKVIKNG